MLTTSPGLESYQGKAEQALLAYLNRYGGNIEQRAAAARYQYLLDNVREDWADTTYRFKYQPIENKNRGRDQIASADDDRRQYYPSDWDGRTGRRVFPSPKDAVEDIPTNPNLGWRGMSWEEWRLSEKRGFIQSMGLHNFHNQQNLTFYGYTPDTAMSYAGGFAPAAFRATPTKPGIVIGVSRQALMDRTKNPEIPSGELAHEGPLPFSQIAQVYMLIATTSRPGMLELIVNRNGKISEGSRSDVSIGYAIRRLR